MSNLDPEKIEPIWEPQNKGKKYPSVHATGIFMLVVVGVFFAVNLIMAAILDSNEEWAKLYNESATFAYCISIVMTVLAIGLPTYVMLMIYKGDKDSLLRLNPISGKEMVITVCISVVMFVGNLYLSEFNMLLASLFTRIDLPQTPPVITTSDKLALMLSVVVAAPVLEELMMRGVIMRGMEGKSKWFAFIVTGAFFGMLHLNYYTLIPKVLGGILLCYMVFETNSIYTGMIVHLINNALSGLATILADDMAGELADVDINAMPLSDTLVSMAISLGISIMAIGLILGLLAFMRMSTRTPDKSGKYIYKGSVRERLESEKPVKAYSYIPMAVAFLILAGYMALDMLA